MSYSKILVDNLICKRRFHLTFDSEAPRDARAEVRCSHCNATIYARNNHPPLRIVREENLTTTTNLSSLQASECFFYNRADTPQQS